MGGGINGSAAHDCSGSAVSMSQDGLRVAIGSSLSDGSAKKNAGHVRVFEWKSASSSWDQVGADIDGASALDQFGRAISLSDDGDLVAVGAPFWSDEEKGRVRVFFLKAGVSWAQYGESLEGIQTGIGSDGSSPCRQSRITSPRRRRFQRRRKREENSG